MITQAEARRIIFRARFGTHLVNDYVIATMQSISRALTREYEGETISALAIREFNKTKRSINLLVDSSFNKMLGSINSELAEMGFDDAEFMQGIYEKQYGIAFSAVKESVVAKAYANSIMALTHGTTTTAGKWIEFIEENKTYVTRLIDGAVSIGWRDGLTNSEISQNIRGVYNRSTKSYNGGILNKNAVNRLDALVRTGVSHYSSIARDELIAANTDIIDTRILWATFDSRTSDICLSRHMKEWKVEDETYPKLPFHYHERSVYIYRLVGEDDPFTGQRSSKGDEDGKPIDSKTTVDEFLRMQSPEFVSQTLGKRKAKLFLDGGLTIDKFTDAQGRSLTLNQIKATKAGEIAFGKING